jgi:hypothetical protein
MIFQGFSLLLSIALVSSTVAASPTCVWDGSSYSYQAQTCTSNTIDYDPSAVPMIYQPTYTYSDARDPRDNNYYADPNLSALTDGQSTYNYQTLAAWVRDALQTPHEVTFDFGKVVSVTQVDIDFAYRAAWGMQAPESISVSFSSDGVTYGPAQSLTSAQLSAGVQDGVNKRSILGQSTCSGNPTSVNAFEAGRYAKVVVTCPSGAANVSGKNYKCGLSEVEFLATPCTPVPTVAGDPHFRTWGGEMYDFHGVCDLVLLQNPAFDNGKGIDIHIRTTRTRQWSYVSAVAVGIDNETFEVVGGKNSNNYWLNGEPGDDQIQTDTYLKERLSGYPIQFQQLSEKSRQFIIELDNNQSVSISTWNSFVKVELKGTKKEDFENSLGLLGSFGEGIRMGRDGTTAMEETDAFGQEWQVGPTDKMLFHSREGPQYPEACEIPSKSEMRRRLGQNKISHEDAALACSRVEDQFKDICIFDVMATNDKDAAGAY